MQQPFTDVHVFDGCLKHVAVSVAHGFSATSATAAFDTTKVTATQRLIENLTLPVARRFAECIVQDGPTAAANHDTSNNTHATVLLEDLAQRVVAQLNQRVEPTLVQLVRLWHQDHDQHFSDRNSTTDDTKTLAGAEILPPLEDVCSDPTLLSVTKSRLLRLRGPSSSSKPGSTAIASTALTPHEDEAVRFFGLDPLQLQLPPSSLSSTTIRERLHAYHVCIQEERLCSMLREVETQLADMSLGSCPQGRCTRLLQLLVSLEPDPQPKFNSKSEPKP